MRGDATVHEDVDFSALCHEVLQLALRTFPASTRIEPKIAPNLRVAGTRGKLSQMLLNPCINARDAMPDGGTLTFRAEIESADDRSRSLPPGHHIVVTIADTGGGMDEATLERALEPFSPPSLAGSAPALAYRSCRRSRTSTAGAWR